MSKKNIDSGALRATEWDQAWQLVCRLASTRRDILAETDPDRPLAWTGEPALSTGIAAPAVHRDEFEARKFMRAVAEIEQASMALRQAEPALEAWRHEEATKTQLRKPNSVWLAIAILWSVTGLVTASALISISYLIS